MIKWLLVDKTKVLNRELDIRNNVNNFLTKWIVEILTDSICITQYTLTHDLHQCSLLDPNIAGKVKVKTPVFSLAKQFQSIWMNMNKFWWNKDVKRVLCSLLRVYDYYYWFGYRNKKNRNIVYWRWINTINSNKAELLSCDILQGFLDSSCLLLRYYCTFERDVYWCDIIEMYFFFWQHVAGTCLI